MPSSIVLLRIGLLLAACLVVAALVSQLSRDVVTPIGAGSTPQRISTSPSPPTNLQPGPSLGPATAETAPAQATPTAQTAPQKAAAADAGLSELMQLQQATARDVANLKREIEQLKSKQDQIATDNSKAIEQLKATQEDTARLLAKASQQSALPVTSAPSTVTSPPSAGPTQSPQVRARPRAPRPRRHYSPRWQYYDYEW